MFKRIFSTVLALSMVLCVTGCKSESNVEEGEKNIQLSSPAEYENHEFEISAFWCPYDISVEGLQEYKDAGFNTLFTGNHSLSWTSDNQFYLGSNRTMTALENAKEVGLNVILNYNDWIALGIEGDDYYGDTPFSKHDVYGDYKDIIVGIHMGDEPSKKHIPGLANSTLIEDFKKVYPNAKYIVNLLPEYANVSPDNYGFETYEEMWELYGDEILSQFETNRSSSIDFYFFYKDDEGKRQTGVMKNYDYYATFAKENNSSQTFIMQSACSTEVDNGFAKYQGNEFMTSLSEGDMRLQANMAMAFGADAMQYYCYSVPILTKEDGSQIPMYANCILNPDNTPSEVYYHVQKVNAEAQALAPAILSYEWQEATAVAGLANVVQVGEYYNMAEGKFLDTKYYQNVQGTQNVVMSRFTSDKYGEAYMLVNFAEREFDNTVDLEMKNCTKLALYGGVGFDGTPEIVELDSEGKCQLNLAYGEGVFIVPLS